MKVSILTEQQIAQKIKRMAFEIWEKNSTESEIVILGIADSGAVIAEKLVNHLNEISPLKVEFHTLSFDKKNLKDLVLDLPTSISDKSVIIVDDVANSGSVLMYTMKALLALDPRKIQVAVLVDRKHKDFPINPDIIGHTLFTTIQEHIEVTSEGNTVTGAYLL